MSFKADSNLTLVLDGSCSTDPDLSPQTNGPAQQGLSYSFECWRPCETTPFHNASDPFWGFVPWSSPANPYPYTSSCFVNDSSYESNKGCFRPLGFHIAGPLTTYYLSDWKNGHYPLNYTSSATINRVCFLSSYELLIFLPNALIWFRNRTN